MPCSFVLAGWQPKDQSTRVLHGSVLHGVIPRPGHYHGLEKYRVTFMVGLWDSATECTSPVGAHGPCQKFPHFGMQQHSWTMLTAKSLLTKEQSRYLESPPTAAPVTALCTPVWNRVHDRGQFVNETPSHIPSYDKCFQGF